ncbi:MAG: hypothetical protein NXI32_14415 [bacterium]|nr:hypothetical protein [bacterium]
MPKQFENFGLAFLFPDNWSSTEDEASQAVMLESPEGAFLSVTRVAEQSVEESLSQAQAAMEGEYDEIEQEPLSKEIGDRQLQGVTQRFVYLDLIITSHLLAFSAPSGVYLIQMQAEDRDMTRLSQVFDAILTSMCQSVPSQA